MNNKNFTIFMVLRAGKIKSVLFFFSALLAARFFIHISFSFLIVSTAFLVVYLKLHPYFKARIRIWKLSRTPHNFSKSGTFLRVDDIGVSSSELVEIKNKIASNGETLLAEIDQDGFFLPLYRMKFNLPLVDEDKFMRRHKHKVSLVALDSGIAIRKDFGKNYILFSNEITALSKISGCCNVPKILRADFTRHVLFMSYVPGRTIRQMLADAGAKILDRDMLKQIASEDSNVGEQWKKRIEDGKKYLKDVIDKATIQRISHEISTIHECGVCLYDIKYGNIILEEQSNEPYFIDLENSIQFKRAAGFFFEKAMNYDLHLLDLHFGIDP